MLDEAQKRRSDFVPGVAFTLADGQFWHFQEPRLEGFPQFSEDGELHVGMASHFGLKFDAIVEQIGETTGFTNELTMAFKLATTMLRANYDLSDADLGELLRFKIGDDASFKVYSSIFDVALGRSPKDFPVG